MIPYTPSPNETCRVSNFFIEVVEVDDFIVRGWVKVNENRRVFCTVPMQACEPFDAVKDSIENDFND